MFKKEIKLIKSQNSNNHTTTNHRVHHNPKPQNPIPNPRPKHHHSPLPQTLSPPPHSHPNPTSVGSTSPNPTFSYLKMTPSSSPAFAWYWTNRFVLEIVFHNWLLKHKCRVMELESARVFYILFYAGLAVGKYLWSNSSEEECNWVGGWVKRERS